MKTLSIYSLLFLFYAITVSNAQQATIVFEKIDESTGLPTERVTDIFEDSDGVMWLGGFDGLSRYDGHRFDLFRSHINDHHTLSGNNISTIAEDLSKRLWIGTINTGLNVSDSSKSKFYNVSEFIHSKSLKPSSTIYDLTVDYNGRIWVAGNLGLQLYESQADSFVNSLFEILGEEQVSVINDLQPQVLYCDDGYKIWIGCRKGLCIIDLKNYTLQTPKNSPFLPANHIDDITTDRNNRIWISRKSSESRLMYFRDNTETFIPFHEIPFESPARRMHFRIDKDNRIWASVFGEQLYGYDLRDSSLFLVSSQNSNILKERFIRRPYVDNFGNLWVPGARIFKYHYSRGFRNYLHPFDFMQATTGVYKEEDQLWVGYRESGMLRIDFHNNNIQRYYTNAKAPFRLPTDLIQGFQRLSNGKLAIIGFPYYILLNKNHQVERVVRLRGSSRTIFEDSRQNVWVGGFNGLLKFNLDGDSLATYTLPAFNNESRNFIRSVAEDSEGNIWFASSGLGLAKLHPDTEEIEIFLPEKGENSLVSAFLFDMILDQDQLWIGTDLGLMKMNLTTEQFTPVSLFSDHSNDRISSIVKHGEDQLWIATLKGIVNLNIKDNTLTRYTRSDGLLNNVYYDVAKSRDKDKIYFGGANGVDYFNPKDIRPKFSELKPKLLQFKINNTRIIPEDQITNGENLSFNHRADLIEIEFGATRFISNEKVEYSYKVDGLTPDFISLEDQRRLIFTDLAPGEYVLHIRAREKMQSWSPHTLSIPFRIIPPIWKRTWAQLLLTLLVLSLGYLFMIIRERRIKKIEQKESLIKQRVLKLEKMALLAQMNPHFMFNSMNAIQQFIAVGDNEGALRYLAKFGRLIRQVIQVSVKEKITVREDAKLIESYLDVEKMRYPKRLNYRLNVADELINRDFYIPPFLIQPHIELAIRKSLLNTNQPGHVKISMTRVVDHIRLLIEDNGSSPDHREGQTDDEVLNGTSIVEQRLKHLNIKLGNQKVQKNVIRNLNDEIIGNRVELLITILDTPKG